MMKKLFTAAAALMLAAALCLASCGDGDSSSEAADTSSVSSSSASAEESSSAEQSKADSTEESSAAAIAADTSAVESKAEVSVSEQEPEITPAEDSSESSTPAPSGSLAGKWELEEINTGEITAKGTVEGHPVAILFQFEFKENGTAEMMQSEYGKDIKRYSMNWKEKENGLALLNQTGDEVSDFTLEDGRLVGKLGNATLKLVKVDEFTTLDNSNAGEPEDDSTPAESLSAEQVVGLWEMTELRVDNMTVNDPAKTVGIMQFNFREDGTGITYRNEGENSESEKIKWSISGDTMTVLDEDDDPAEFQMKNGMLEFSIYANGQKMIFKLKRVDSLSQ